ncbi:MAG: STAS domain-containing protein [Blautia sp.]|nr:STAS domain-containing protein [Blautia sp.]
MTVNTVKDGTTLKVAIDGRVDTQTSPELEKVLKEAMEGITDLELDFKDLIYISSAGLRVILGAQNRMDAINGNMVIKGAAKKIVDIFKVTGFDTFLNIE